MQNEKRKLHPLLVITELFLPTKGGTAVWFDQVYPRMGGKEIHIVTRDVPGGKAYDSTHANSVHRVVLERYAWLRPESLLFYLKLFFVSFWLALRHRVTAVHAGRVLPEGLVGLLVARLLRRPLVIYAHGEEITSWKAPRRRKALRYVYQNADSLIANSDFTRDQLVGLGVTPDKIFVIHPGVNIEAFRPGLACDDLKQQIKLKQAEHLLLSVGRLSRRKGFDMSIRAVARLLEEDLDIQYVLIGIGEDLAYLRNLSEELEISDRVHLLGHVDVDDLPRWYNACTLFLMPNREVDGDIEGFGMVFLEAAACGKTAISGASGGAPSAVLHQRTGLNVDGTDLDAVVASLRHMLINPEQRHSLAVAAHSRANEQFSWQSVAQKISRLAEPSPLGERP